MKKSATTSSSIRSKRKPYFDNPAVEAKAAGVYKDGFNIYQAVSKLKKKMNRQSFPDEVIIGVCDSYWNCKTGIKQDYPWFLASMEYQTRLWICDKNEAEGAKYKQGGMAQSIKDILKNL